MTIEFTVAAPERHGALTTAAPPVFFHPWQEWKATFQRESNHDQQAAFAKARPKC